MDTKHAGMSGTGHSDVEYNGARQCRCDMAAGGRCSYHHKKYRRQGLFLLLGLAASVLVGNVLLKNIVARPRPCRIDASVPLLIANPTDYSFLVSYTNLRANETKAKLVYRLLLQKKNSDRKKKHDKLKIIKEKRNRK